MFKLLVCQLLLALSVLTTAVGQSLENALQRETMPVRTIDVADTNYTDLDAFGKAVGSARVIMLGEQDHGDGETFRAKARLVRYLHERLGFRVLAFESDFYSIHRAWETTGSIGQTMPNVFGIWRNMQEFQPLTSYLKSQENTPNSLSLAGFDSQIFGSYAKKNLFSELQQALVPLGYTTSDSTYARFLQTLANTFDPKQCANLTESEYNVFSTYMNRLIAQMNAHQPQSFWGQTLRSLRGNAEDRWANRRNPEQYNISAHKAIYDHRDRQMAENLLWLVQQKYPTEKIIVWAHNFHVSRRTADIQVAGSSYPRTVNLTMGNNVGEALGDDLFVVGFNSYNGRSGSPYQRSRPFRIRNSHQDLYARAIRHLNHPYGFTTFRSLRSNASLNQPFPMRGWGYEYPMQGRWLNCFDALFYIQTNRASREN